MAIPKHPATPEDFRRYLKQITRQKVKVDRSLPSGVDVMTLSLGSAVPLEAEIDELARGLRYDPGLMYRFVHDHIEFDPMWGDVKGAAMTLMDRSGDAFDQASLLIALLTKADGKGHTVKNIRYVVGEIQLDGAQTRSWLAIPDNGEAASSVLLTGGIPADPVMINPDGTIDYVRMNHVWVKATIDSEVHEFDPSFKSHVVKDGPQEGDLASAMGYDQTEFLTSALQGYSSGNNWVKRLNQANITASLTTYTMNFVEYVKTQHPAGDLADIIGGKRIIPASESALPPPLPYIVRSQIDEFDDSTIPPAYRTTLRIQHWDNINHVCDINEPLDSSRIYGRRLTLTYDTSNHAQLLLDGSVLASGNPSTPEETCDIMLSVNHPYVSDTNEYCDDSRPAQIKAGDIYHIVNGWGQVGTEILEKHRRALEQNRHNGRADDSEEVSGESFALIGLTWCSEVCRTQKILGQLGHCTVSNQHCVGVTGQRASPYIDMPVCRMSTGSHTGNDVDRKAVVMARAGQGSAYEHGVIRQLEDFNAVSTVKLLTAANERTDENSNRIFSVTETTEWIAVQEQLVNYSPSELANVSAYIQSSHTVYLPQFGDLPEGAVTGKWRGLGFMAIKTYDGETTVNHIISGGYNGGYALEQDAKDEPSNVTINTARPAMYISADGHSKTAEPIDLVTGAYIYDHTDLAVGNGRPPFGLPFCRQYNSGHQLEDGSLGLGWTHAYDMTTRVTSDSFQATGDDSPIDAAANIVALYVTFDLYRSPSLAKHVICSICQKWLMDQMIDNIVVVKLGHEALQFVKLPDGSFNPPPGKALQLVQEPNETYLLKDPAGNRLIFDANNRATQWSDPHGNVVDFAYNDNGKLASMTSKIGGSVASRSLSFTYETADPNHIETVTDSTGRSISFDYDPNGSLTSYTDPEGYITEFDYYGPNDPNEGLMWQVFYPDRPDEPYATNVYDSLGRVRRQTNAAGQTYDYFYSYYRTEELEPAQTPPGGPAARYSKTYYFDDHGQTVAVRDQLGRQTTTEYDGQQRPIRVVSPTCTSVEYTYDPNHNVIETRSKPVEGSALPDIVQTATYTSHQTTDGRWLNRLASQTDAAGNTTTHEYDFNDPNCSTVCGDLRKVTLPQVLDYRGQPVTATQQFTYNAYGQPETVTDVNGIVTKFEYYTPVQGAGLKKTIVDFGSGSPCLNLATEFTYDSVGDVNTVTDAQGHVAQSEYYPSRRLKKTISPAPFLYETHYEYYEDGHLKRTRQQMGPDLWQVMDYTYTPTGEQATIKGPYQLGEATDENFTQFTYDALDRLWKVMDAEDNVTETLYWPDGQVAKTIDAEGHEAITNTYYDPNGLLYSVQDANGNETVYDYDDFCRPFRTRYADDTYEQVTYDPNGRVDQTRTRAGQITQFAYDALNRRVSKTLAGNTTTYGYDISGRTVTTTDNAGTLRNTFDRLGRVSTATQTNDATVSYLYDELSRRTRLTYPDSNYVTYGYDSLGRLTDVNDPNSDPLAHYEYDHLSRQVSVLYANGTETGYAYSNTNRLLQLGNATLTQPSTYAYTYDLVGNRTGMLVNGAEAHNYTYDHIYQLTNADYPQNYFQADTTFTYDDAGNRSQVTSPSTTYTTNNLNQYTSVGSDSFSYDDNGNLTSDGHQSYTYDAENRLVTAVVDGQTTQYTYDAAGRRIRKNVAGQITQYVYDGDQVIAEYDGEGTPLRTFIYGPGIDEPICLYAYDLVLADLTGDGLVNLADLLALAGKWLLTRGETGYDSAYDLSPDGRIDNGDTDVLSAHWQEAAAALPVFYYHFDGLGSVVALSDAAGNVVETYAYDAYGRSQPTGPATGNPYRFAGYHFDPETGLYFCRARSYNPAIGRFLQPDPLGYADGINWHLYCGNNPILFVDPLGLCYKPTAGEWVGGIASGVGQGLLNTAQGLQDLAIGTVNLATGWVGALKPYGQGFNGLNTVIPAIPSPQWARDVFVKESDLAYNAEKFVTSTAATVGVGAIIKAATAPRAAAMAPIIGGAQGSVTHQLATYREATALAKSGAYERVYINRSLKTITGGELDSLLKPDVTGLLKNGRIDMIEVVSPSQTFKSQMQKIQQMEGLLGPRRAGTGSRAVYP
jgi:RHS repeat-associated protein